MSVENPSIDLSPEKELKQTEILHELELRQSVEKEQDGVTYFEVTNPVELFKWVADRHFLFHGSPKLLTDLEPRKATDVHREAGRKNAVYMSEDHYAPMAKTILGNATCHYSIKYPKREAGEDKVQVSCWTSDLSKVNKEGFMYIIDAADSDEIQDGDHVSYKPVTPLAVIRFTREDFKYPIEEKPEETVKSVTKADFENKA